MGDLSDRMKAYEACSKTTLPLRVPVVIRCDGKAFSRYTKNLKKPFDQKFKKAMQQSAREMCGQIQGCQLAYVQSDEISFLIHNYKKLNSQSWFDNKVQKIVSVSASMAAAYMTKYSQEIFGEIRPAFFDSRVFLMPEKEVNNYFLFRQQDATRNSIQMLARSLYSDKQCFKKSGKELQEMIFEKGLNWNDLPADEKRGACVVKQKQLKTVLIKKEEKTIERSVWQVDENIPIFSQDKNYIEKHLEVSEE